MRKSTTKNSTRHGGKNSREVGRLIVQSQAVLRKNSPRSAELARKASLIAIRLKDNRLVAESRLAQGRAGLFLADYEQVKTWATEAMTLFKVFGDEHNTAMAILQIGWADYQRGNYRSTMIQNTEALAIGERIDDLEIIQQAVSQLAVVEE